LFGNQGAQEGLQIGGASGAAAGALLGSIVPGIGTAVGAIGGGLLGSIGGSLFGGLFGGGDDDKTKGSFSGGIGSASFGGSSEISSIVQKIDQSILSLLDSRQRAAVQRLKIGGTNISVSGGLSSSDVEGITSQRIRPVARALGFNEGAVLRGDAEQAVKNLQTAIATQRAIDDLTSGASEFDQQVEALSTQFFDLRSNAKRFGISLDGVAEANTKAYRDLVKAREEQRKAQDAAILGALDPFRQLAAPLEALQKQLEDAALSPARQFASAQAEFQRIAGLAEGGDLGAIADFNAVAARFIELAGQVGASPGQADAIRQVQAALPDILAGIKEAEEDAASDVVNELTRLRREVVDTLHEMVEEQRLTIRELKRTR
jgi:hypothetical protein